jgi:hypothetical protein
MLSGLRRSILALRSVAERTSSAARAKRRRVKHFLTRFHSFDMLGSYERLEERVPLAPVPVVTIGSPGPVMIGQSVSLSVQFDNQASGAPTVGYGPYVDLFVDTTGADGVAPGTVEPRAYRF